MLFVLEDGKRFTLHPGTLTLSADSYAKLEKSGAFQSRRAEGHIAVVNRPAKIPWERMAESVRREYELQLQQERERERLEQRQANLDAAFDDAWGRLREVLSPRDDSDMVEVVQMLHDYEVAEYRRVMNPEQ